MRTVTMIKATTTVYIIKHQLLRRMKPLSPLCALQWSSSLATACQMRWNANILLYVKHVLAQSTMIACNGLRKRVLIVGSRQNLFTYFVDLVMGLFINLLLVFLHTNFENFVYIYIYKKRKPNFGLCFQTS